MAVSYHDHEVNSRLKNKRSLGSYLTGLVRSYGFGSRGVALSYIFCSDEYLLQMNQQFLDHDTFTDIITFDLGGDAGRLEGEIYISVDRVAENAAKFGTDYQQELHRVIFHGALHLCGLKDKSKADKQRMREAEDQALAGYFQKEHS